MTSISIRTHYQQPQQPEQQQKEKAKQFTFRRPGYRYTVHAFNLGPSKTWVSLQLSKANLARLVASCYPEHETIHIKGVDVLQSGFGWTRLYANYSHAAKDLLLFLNTVSKTLDQVQPNSRVQARQAYEQLVASTLEKLPVAIKAVPVQPSVSRPLPGVPHLSIVPSFVNVRVTEGPSVDPRRLLLLKAAVNSRFGH